MDPRVCDLVLSAAAPAAGPAPHVTIVGFPYDTGVQRNGGRVGARLGPAAFLKLLLTKRTGTAINAELDIDLTLVVIVRNQSPHLNPASSLRVGNYGLIDADLPLEEAHKRLEDAVKAILDAGSIPFIVGGGNDQSYPNASALLSHVLEQHPRMSVGVINIDAHLDVRPKTHGTNLVHSGTPFRQLLEDKRFASFSASTPASANASSGPHFVEFAAQGSQCAKSHADFVHENKGSIVWLRDVLARAAAAPSQGGGSVGKVFSDTLSRMSGDRLFVSFDLDAVRSADAPGVSCPSPMGLSAKDALDICFESGANPRVALFDVSELNPEIEEYRSARLVAMMFYYFLMGLSVRMKNSTGSKTNSGSKSKL
ncbi:hypothetical protein HDU82_003086 [Entophlyctis luteolus]|nr:hypothetical protein HDU82_003086 [Entophlyctis luteolus]